MTLPETIDFDDTAFPELSEIFREIELGIASLIAGEESLHKRPARRRQTVRKAAPALKRDRAGKRAAA